jgi:hypothetical protein
MSIFVYWSNVRKSFFYPLATDRQALFTILSSVVLELYVIGCNYVPFGGAQAF